MHHPTFPAKKSNLNSKKYEELLIQVIKNGKPHVELPAAQEIAEYKKERFRKLNPEFKRFDNPHIYKVGISTRLMEVRDNLLNLLKP